jgi:hypothetical protein
VNDYNPVNQITMRNMATLSIRIHNTQQRLLASIPSKYHPLVDHYGKMVEAQIEIDQTLDNGTPLSFAEYHAIKEESIQANEAAATIKPLFSNELKETVLDVWSMVNPNRDAEVDTDKEIIK